MIAVRLLWLAVLLVAIPAWVGNCFLNVDKPCRNPVFLWISGQMLLWAGFQVICVPVILLEGRMWMVTVAYCGYILVLLAAATVRYFRQSRTLRAVREAKPEKAEIILWVLAGVLLLVQLVLAVLMLLGIIPVLAEFICWKRDHETKAIKHLSLIGFALFYTVLLFTAQCNMVYAFVIPMMFAVMPYHDVKAFVLINVGTVVENILVVLLGATQGGFGYLGQDAGFIQISVMILLCITSIYATISNQKNTDENIESITAAQDRTEATLREVMEMSSRMETSVADITAELNKLETAFDSTKIAMEEVSAGSGESAAAIQQQTAQTEAIQEKVNTVSEVAETIGNNMEHTIEILDAGKEEMTGLKEQAEDSARNSELAAQKLETLDHYMQEMHSIVEIISKIANQTSLLALNASIEAARAGEAGRGFSVVATEISGMATQTKDATGNIAELIQNVSGAIGEVVTVIRQMIDGIGSQREGTMRAADSFTAIEDSSYMIVDNLGELLQIVEALKTANQEIVDSIQTISATTEEVSAHASETLEAEERNREILQKITENMNSMVKK